MTDKEFWDMVITERMQIHSSRARPLTDEELATALQLEAEYDHALENLPPKIATAIREFHENVVNKLTEEQIFFYQKGIADGLLLYRTLQNL